MVAKTNAERRLAQLGIAHRLHDVGDHVKSGEAMAAALDVPLDRVLRTLVFAVSRGGREAKALVLAPSHRLVDPKRFAKAAGAERARLATPEEAKRWTGLEPGGISAVGLTGGRLEVWIDAGALEHICVFVSAGRLGFELELSPADLMRAADARPVQL